MVPFTALAHPNIAFIKYWGNRNDILRLPANGSISMNLEGLETRTTVQFDDSLPSDELNINGKVAVGAAAARVSKMLDEFRTLSGIRQFARVKSENNFPSGAGIASSASAFAALTLAASKAAGMHLDRSTLSRLARHGSGSACRSIPGGFVEWTAGIGDEDSYAASIAPQDHWDLVDCIAVISSEHKLTGSTEGHAHAGTSPLQTARLDDAPRRLEICRKAILNCDFPALAEIVELDSNLMHAVMITSRPPLFYWLPATLAIMHTIRSAREKGLSACYTIDAGPNVHVICLGNAADETVSLLKAIPGVQSVLQAKVGGPARLVEDPLHNNH
jgi:diphosphomevalonate decarboxylase